uniref:Uncharacterized protein n=1 Tax=Trypanosoma vivax (strain Y486) TaxID=1055687 RepID=G0UB87_TRYVY|nr:hypothetical protein TVY486_1105580 [Trypanosoma vivax Y486]
MERRSACVLFPFFRMCRCLVMFSNQTHEISVHNRMVVVLMSTAEEYFCCCCCCCCVCVCVRFCEGKRSFTLVSLLSKISTCFAFHIYVCINHAVRTSYIPAFLFPFAVGVCVLVISFNSTKKGIKCRNSACCRWVCGGRHKINLDIL